MSITTYINGPCTDWETGCIAGYLVRSVDGGFTWVTENMNLTDLQNRVLADTEFRNRLVSYLQTTICEVVDEPRVEEYKDGHPDLDRFADNPNNSTDEFGSRMEADSNYIFSRCRLHRHTFTCFKYGKKKPATDGFDDNNNISQWDSPEGERLAKRMYLPRDT